MRKVQLICSSPSFLICRENVLSDFPIYDVGNPLLCRLPFNLMTQNPLSFLHLTEHRIKMTYLSCLKGLT